MGSALAESAKFTEAVATLQEGLSAFHSGMGQSIPGYTYALMGRQPEAQKLLGELTELRKTRYVSAAWIAAVHAGLGAPDATME
jgi:hypothetical protein